MEIWHLAIRKLSILQIMRMIFFNCKLSKMKTTWRENLDVLFDNLPAIKFVLMEWVIW